MEENIIAGYDEEVQAIKSECLRMPIEVVKEVRFCANKHKISFNAMYVIAIREGLKQIRLTMKEEE